MEKWKNAEADRPVLEEFYHQNHRISLYFFAIVLPLLVSGAYLEFLRSNRILFLLDIISAVLCISAIFVLYFFEGVSIAKRLLVSSLLLSLILLEIETQFYDNNSRFFQIEMWIINPILLLLIAFFFNGPPRAYFLFSLIGFSYFVVRIAWEGLEYFETRAIWILLADMLALESFCFFLNVWWFGYRIENLKKTDKLKRQLVQERESMSRNLHDYLGAKVTDLSFLVKSIQSRQTGDMESVLQLQKLSEEIFHGVREITAAMEDAKLISEDIWSGIRVLLLRRYGNGGRKIKFSREGDLDYSSDAGSAEQLLGIVTEICSNDLKYGTGISHWTFKTNPDKLRISLRANSRFMESRKGAIGHKSIRERAVSIGADWMENLDKENYSGVLEIPLGKKFRRIEAL